MIISIQVTTFGLDHTKTCQFLKNLRIITFLSLMFFSSQVFSCLVLLTVRFSFSLSFPFHKHHLAGVSSSNMSRDRSRDLSISSIKNCHISSSIVILRLRSAAALRSAPLRSAPALLLLRSCSGSVHPAPEQPAVQLRGFCMASACLLTVRMTLITRDSDIIGTGSNSRVRGIS